MQALVRTALTSATLVVLAACSTTPITSSPATAKGDALVDNKGMTLYVFDKDANGKSACNGKCLFDWPPVFANDEAKAAGYWTIIDRDDGLRQWAYKGKPIYTFDKDKKAGDRLGDGVNNVWHVAKP
jgi:predicted lipoprotein with Yx(FWY)xxD motif